MTEKFNKNNIGLHCAETKALLKKRKLPYAELLELTAQSMLLAKIRDEENKNLNNIIEKYSSLTNKLPAMLEEFSKNSLENMGVHCINAVKEGIEFQKYNQAIKAATKRHVETHAIEKAAIEYYVSDHLCIVESLTGRHKTKAKNKAAEEMTKQQPIEFRTARRYIDKYHKNTAC